jgi:hypothetical protein
MQSKWCKSCQLNNLKEIFINWTSNNEKIDYYIQEMQLGINDYNDIIFEWIPYKQFNNIRETKKDAFTAVYSTKWKDGPLKYNFFNKKE